MATLLATHEDGSPNFDCRRLTAPIGGPNNVVERATLLEDIDELFRDPTEVSLLHFSGHGTQNNLGGFLVTQDADRYDEGVRMTDVLELANASRADEVVIFLDCCHAGHLGNVPAINNRATLREGISILTASRGDQPSVEVGGAGLFTSLVADALAGGAADLLGQVTAPGVYATVEAALGAWDQRPLFKSHVSKMIALRKCVAPIGLAILRELPVIFPVPAEDLALSPEYEERHPGADPAKVDVMKKLQALNRVRLVVPVNAPHMYDAAIESRACRLTAAGRYYWRLANDHRI
jgi:hypothetical protein